MKLKTVKSAGFILLFLLVTAQSVHAQLFDAVKARVKEHTLENGMTFIVLERSEAPVISFHVYADVGSANESYGITGISHLLEHMAFKGTKTVGTTDYQAELRLFEKMDALYDQMIIEKARPNPDTAAVSKINLELHKLREEAKEYVINNEYFDMMMQQGDAGVNAYTSADATQYINSLPSNKLEFWMAMTSDRFLNPVIREFFKEKDVVMEERRLAVESQPIGMLVEDFLGTAFKAHPYKHSVVGHMSDLENIRRSDVENYFNTFYQPGNLTAVIIGDINAEEVFKLADLYFGRIPGGRKPEPVRTREPEQWGERHVKVEAKSQPVLIAGYHRPAETHPDHAALEALANILGEGRSSRLWETLVKEEKAAVQTGAFNGFPGSKYPNLIAFLAVSAHGRTSDECMELIEKEIEKIRQEPVTEMELTKFKQSQKKSIIDRMKSNSGMAASLSHYAVVHGDWRMAFNQIEAVERLTAEDVKKAANTYLVSKNRTIAEIIPEEASR